MPLWENTLRAAVPVSLILALSACSTSTRVTSTWQAERPAAAPFSKLLIVGVSDNATRRRQFEIAMAEAVRRSGNQAEPSVRVIAPEEPLNRDSVAAAVSSQGADAVLVTRLVSREVQAEQVEARAGVKTRRKDDYAYDFFRYDYEEYEEPGYLVAKNTVVLASDLYETTAGQLICRITTTTRDKESAFEIFDEASAAVVRRLRRDELIR